MAPKNQDTRVHEYLDIQFRKRDIGLIETVWNHVQAVKQELLFF